MSLRKRLRPSPAWLRFIALGLVLLFGSQTARAQIRTVLVSPVPGNPTASGTALQTALAGISSPSSANRWLLKLEPGIYDVGSTSLQMRSWVDIEGSGIGVTTIRGSVPFTSSTFLYEATVFGADNAELRLLTVEATADAASGAVAMGNYNASPRIYRVKFSSVAGTPWGVRNFNSATQIEECEITATATSGSSAYGVVFRGDSPANKGSVSHSRILVSGAGNNYGVYLADALSLQEIRDSRVDVTGGSNSRGLYADGSGWSFVDGESLRVRNTEINSAGGSTASYGMHLTAPLGLEITESKVWGTGSPETYGIFGGGIASLIVQNSWVIGFTNSISNFASPSITGTILQGSPVSPAALAGLDQEFDVMGYGDVGIGTATPTEKLHVFENENANSMLVVENPNPGASAAGVLRAKSDTAYVNLGAHGSGRTLSRFGQALGSWSEILQVNGNGLILGTLSTKPLILGTNSTNRLHITGTGSVGVGTSVPTSLFHVSGGDVRVTGGNFIDDGVTLNAPDYVFEPDYSLKSLDELREFIDREKHLPNIPSAAEIKANGLKLGQFQMLLLEKVEELTLYTLDQDEEIRRLRTEKAELEKQFEDRLSTLERALGLFDTRNPQ